MNYEVPFIVTFWLASLLYLSCYITGEESNDWISHCWLLKNITVNWVRYTDLCFETCDIACMLLSEYDTTPVERSTFRIIQYSLDRTIRVCELNSLYSKFNPEASLPFFLAYYAWPETSAESSRVPTPSMTSQRYRTYGGREVGEGGTGVPYLAAMAKSTWRRVSQKTRRSSIICLLCFGQHA
jgi:hypothetical protein